MCAVVTVIFGVCNSMRLLTKVKVTLRLAVYSQSVRLSAKPLEADDQSFFLLQPLLS
jgi:hypothetical protein